MLFQSKTQSNRYKRSSIEICVTPTMIWTKLRKWCLRACWKWLWRKSKDSPASMRSHPTRTRIISTWQSQKPFQRLTKVTFPLISSHFHLPLSSSRISLSFLSLLLFPDYHLSFFWPPNVILKGYITEEHRSIVTSSSDGEKSLLQNVSVVGALKSMRRSRSAITIATPGGLRIMSSAMKNRATPLQMKLTSGQQPAPHTSRSKYRTPMTGLRQKAMSVDRMQTITPKVNPANPFSMLRHARAGEPVFSVTGSPIVATS